MTKEKVYVILLSQFGCYENDDVSIVENKFYPTKSMACANAEWLFNEEIKSDTWTHDCYDRFIEGDKQSVVEINKENGQYSFIDFMDGKSFGISVKELEGDIL